MGPPEPNPDMSPDGPSAGAAPSAVANPYLITGPALISVSGGRTSARKLHGIVQAHGGTLPDDVIVAFANTGREREETLRFVHELARWGAHIHWVEFHRDAPGFEVVGYNSASRKGEPFDALIDWKGRLPNGQERWCTEYLKVKPLHALMRSLGYGEPGDYLETIGLRADEGHRILKGLARAEKDGRRITYPLSKASVTKRDIKAFWFGSPDGRYETSTRPQGFDLELPALWGNCDLCFAMGVGIREERVRQEPSVATWWNAAEVRAGGTFSKRESVADLIRHARARRTQTDLFADDLDDSECGSWCPTEEAA